MGVFLPAVIVRLAVLARLLELLKVNLRLSSEVDLLLVDFPHVLALPQPAVLLS